MSKFTLKILLFLVLFISLERFCHKKTHGFRLHKIFSDHISSPRWDVGATCHDTAEIEKLLRQPYTFLASGGESYVFISDDRKTVLKFFKNHHMRERSWLDMIPTPTFLHPFTSYLRSSRKRKRDQFFTSCKIAYEQFASKTGLIHLQLNRASHWNTKITIYDPIGIAHKIDPNILPFALQKGATLAYPTLTSLMEIEEVDAAKLRLGSLVDLIAYRYEKGISNHDPRKRNFGFIGADAIELDLGSFSIDPKLQSSIERRRAFLLETRKLSHWVKKYHPELSEFLDEKIQTVIDLESEIQ